MIRRLSLAVLAALSFSATVPYHAVAQGTVTVGTNAQDADGSWRQYNSNGVVGQLVTAPDGVSALTSFKMLLTRAGQFGMAPTLSWHYRFAIQAVPSDWDERVTHLRSEFGTSIGWDDPIFVTAQQNAAFFDAPTWFGFDALNLPIVGGSRYLLMMYFDGNNGGMTIDGPSVASNFYDISDFAFYCGSCGGLPGKLVYEASYVSVPEPGSLLLLATGGLGLAFVGWRRQSAA